MTSIKKPPGSRWNCVDPGVSSVFTIVFRLMNKINIEWDVYPVSGVVAGSDERVKSIDGWFGYFISDHGRVFTALGRGRRTPNFDNIRELSQSEYTKEELIPYKYVTIRDRGITKNLSIHRQVALAFIPNPDPELYPIVNHLTHHHNNHYKHLEWTDLEGNANHGKKARNHLLISPSGERIIIRGLMKFCRENNLHKCSLYNSGKSKGWLYLGDPNNPRPMPTKKTRHMNGTSIDTRPHLLIDSQGNEHLVNNIRKFCRDNSIDSGCLYKHRKAKGWLYKGRFDQQEPVDATLDRFFI